MTHLTVEQLHKLVNDLRLENHVLKNRGEEKRSGGSVASSTPSSHRSNTSLLDDKYELTGEVTDVGGKLYQLAKTVKGTYYTVREDGQLKPVSSSQYIRRRPDVAN